MSSSGCRKSTDMLSRASTSCWLVISPIWRTRRSSSTPWQRFVWAPIVGHDAVYADTRDVGIRRQPRYPLPGNIRKERHKRRAGILDHGAPDQGAHGHDYRQQQANSAHRPGPGCAERIRRRVLLDGVGKTLQDEHVFDVGVCSGVILNAHGFPPHSAVLSLSVFLAWLRHWEPRPLSSSWIT